MKNEQLFVNGVATFYCRKYVRGTRYQDSPMAAEGERITLVMTVCTDNVPETLKPFVNTFVAKTRTTEDGTSLTSFSFKVGKFCKFFDLQKYEEEGVDSIIPKPLNTELEGKRYDVNLAFNFADKNLNDNLAPSGFWLNGIRMMEHVSMSNPFGAPVAPPQAAAPQAVQEKDDLPF